MAQACTPPGREHVFTASAPGLRCHTRPTSMRPRGRMRDDTNSALPQNQQRPPVHNVHPNVKADSRRCCCSPPTYHEREMVQRNVATPRCYRCLRMGRPRGQCKSGCVDLADATHANWRTRSCNAFAHGLPSRATTQPSREAASASAEARNPAQRRQPSALHRAIGGVKCHHGQHRLSRPLSYLRSGSAQNGGVAATIKAQGHRRSQAAPVHCGRSCAARTPLYRASRRDE